MFTNIKADVKRYFKGGYRACFYAFFEQGLWAVLAYRFSRWLHKFPVPVLNLIPRILGFLVFKFTEIITGISLPTSAEIGRGLYIGHFGGPILHAKARLGENCSLGYGVVVGTRGHGNEGVPVLGDNVHVGVGAKILGGIKIGSNVKIGANAVVITDIPDDATVVGVPGRIVTS